MHVMNVVTPGTYNISGEYDFHGMLHESKTSDYSDLNQLFHPSDEDVRRYGHQMEEFILQCSFDKQDCNMRWVWNYHSK